MYKLNKTINCVKILSLFAGRPPYWKARHLGSSVTYPSDLTCHLSCILFQKLTNEKIRRDKCFSPTPISENHLTFIIISLII